MSDLTHVLSETLAGLRPFFHHQICGPRTAIMHESLWCNGQSLVFSRPHIKGPFSIGTLHNPSLVPLLEGGDLANQIGGHVYLSTVPVCIIEDNGCKGHTIQIYDRPVENGQQSVRRFAFNDYLHKKGLYDAECLQKLGEWIKTRDNNFLLEPFLNKISRLVGLRSFMGQYHERPRRPDGWGSTVPPLHAFGAMVAQKL